MRNSRLAQNIARIDGSTPSRTIGKHLKMASSPFVFFRGTAQLFYSDVYNGVISLPDNLNAIPLTSIVGDCHLSNFGFLTEEGSHGDTVIFSPNDFDDACVGRAHWDIIRLLTSFALSQIHCEGIVSGVYVDNDVDATKPVISKNDVINAQHTFLSAYIETCRRVTEDESVINEAVNWRPEKVATKLAKLYDKAVLRSANGSAFTTKSALARAVVFNNDILSFNANSPKFTPLTDKQYSELYNAFAPFMDDSVVDIVRREDAGTGSVNLDRFYFLVGPQKPHTSVSFSHCHIVEVKQQREAAPLHHFASLCPVNQLNPAHLTARSQRRMQRNPDLILDEAIFENKHYLIRSRHHAKVGISPEDVVMGKKATQGGFDYFAELCGYTLALAHCRGDRRSTRFATAACNLLPDAREQMVTASNEYANKVLDDYAYFCGELALS
ncbi:MULTISPECIES: DUF2252 family protein [unclassified Alteromonas]|uniref:DUF2252 family protein n=1 Tax=unclassified Alteromonas TaxID=2614992 RepID=UPI000509FDEE|nr:MULTISPECIES: DUF2252 family protein [unclassified Alteromonas]